MLERRLPAVEVPDGGRAHLFTDVMSGRPVLWSLCHQIRVVVNEERETRDFVDRAATVLAEVQALSGLDLVLEGTTDEPVRSDRQLSRPDRYGDR